MKKKDLKQKEQEEVELAADVIRGMRNKDKRGDVARKAKSMQVAKGPAAGSRKDKKRRLRKE